VRSNRRLVMASSTTIAFGSRSRSSSSVGGRRQSSAPRVLPSSLVAEDEILFDLENEQVNRNVELALKVRRSEVSPRSVRPVRWSVWGHIFLRSALREIDILTMGSCFPLSSNRVVGARQRCSMRHTHSG